MSNRLICYDPNDLNSLNYSNDGILPSNVNWNQEDLNISVDLQVIVGSTSDCGQTNYHIISNEVVKKCDYVSFMQGNLNYGDKNYQTTDYTNISYQEVKQNKVVSKEDLGITSIDINFDAHFYPIVTIKMVDVRGSSLITPNEVFFNNKIANEDGRDDADYSARSFFDSLFRFPYPRFLLSVKGFYGNRITFTLAPSDFNTDFNSETGDFEVTIKFIGYVYGLYVDLPLDLIFASPYFNKEYWDNGKDEGRFEYVGGGKMYTFIELLERIQRIESANSNEYRFLLDNNTTLEYVKLNQELTDLKDLVNAHNNLLKIVYPYSIYHNDYKEWYGFRKDGFDTIYFYSNTVLDPEVERLVEDSTPPTQVDFVFNKNEIESDLNAYKTKLNNFLDTYELRDTFNTYKTRYSDDISRFDIVDLIENGPITVDAQVDAQLAYDDRGVEDNNSFSKVTGNELKLKIKREKISQTNYILDYDEFYGPFGEIVASGTSTTYEDVFNENYKPLYFVIYREKRFKDFITEIEGKIKLILTEKEQEYEESIFNSLKDIFTFNPSIENIYRMLFAHIDCFMDFFYNKLKTIKENTQRTTEFLGLNESNSDILIKNTDETEPQYVNPFPAYYVNNRKEYPGFSDNINLRNIEEVKLIEEIIDGVSNMNSSSGSGYLSLFTTNRSSGNVEDIVFLYDALKYNFINGKNEFREPWVSFVNYVESEDLNLKTDKGVCILLYVFLCEYFLAGLFSHNSIRTHTDDFVKDRVDRFLSVCNLTNEDITAICQYIEIYALNLSEFFDKYIEVFGRGISSDAQGGVLSLEMNPYLNIHETYIQTPYPGNNYNGYDHVPSWFNNFVIKYNQECEETPYRTLNDYDKIIHIRGEYGILKDYTVSSASTLYDKVFETRYNPNNEIVFWISLGSGAAIDTYKYGYYYCMPNSATLFPKRMSGNENAPENTIVDYSTKFHYNDVTMVPGVWFPGIKYQTKTYTYTRLETRHRGHASGVPTSYQYEETYSAETTYCDAYNLFDSDVFNNIMEYCVDDGINTYSKEYAFGYIMLATIVNPYSFYRFYNDLKKTEDGSMFYSNKILLLLLGAFCYRYRYVIDNSGNDIFKVDNGNEIGNGKYIGNFIPSEKQYIRPLVEEDVEYNVDKSNQTTIFGKTYCYNGAFSNDCVYKDFDVESILTTKGIYRIISYYQYWVEHELYPMIESLKCDSSNSSKIDIYPHGSVKKFSQSISCYYYNSQASRWLYYNLINFQHGGRGAENYDLDGDSTVHFIYGNNVNIRANLNHLISSDGTTTDTVVESYFTKIKTELLSRRTSEVEDENNSNKETSIELELYYLLKVLYDKWLCTYTKSNWVLKTVEEDLEKRFNRFSNLNNNYTECSEYNNFLYIDHFYNDISNRYIIDVFSLKNIIAQYSEGKMVMQVYQFMQRVAEENNLMLLSLPVFNNLYDANMFRQVFEPNVMYGNNNGNRGYGNTYILMYTGEPSKHSEIVTDNNYNFTTDYLDIADILGNNSMFALELYDEDMSNLNYNLSAFVVSFSKQNQMYFKKITVNTDNPKVTNESIRNLIMISDAGNTNGDMSTPSFVGQNLYSIYSNRAYTCTIEMMGCMNIMPMMYFQLNNIPLFRGMYMIINVKHSIKNGDITTVFTGVRVTKYLQPEISRYALTSFLMNKIIACDTSNYEYDYSTVNNIDLSNTVYTVNTNNTVPSSATERWNLILNGTGKTKGNVTKNDIESILTNISVPTICNADGKIVWVTFKFNKNVCQFLLNVFCKIVFGRILSNQEIEQYKGYENISDVPDINDNYTIGGKRFIIPSGRILPPFQWRNSQNSNGGSTGRRSNHAYGIAIDINGRSSDNVGIDIAEGKISTRTKNKNPYLSQSRYNTIKNTDASVLVDSEYQIRTWSHPVVRAFLEEGFGWGIYKWELDYMHFSYGTKEFVETDFNKNATKPEDLIDLIPVIG